MTDHLLAKTRAVQSSVHPKQPKWLPVFRANGPGQAAKVTAICRIKGFSRSRGEEPSIWTLAAPLLSRNNNLFSTDSNRSRNTAAISCQVSFYSFLLCSPGMKRPSGKLLLIRSYVYSQSEITSHCGVCWREVHRPCCRRGVAWTRRAVSGYQSALSVTAGETAAEVVKWTGLVWKHPRVKVTCD